MVTSHDQFTHRILTEIEAGNRVSQRSLSRDMGIALGLTNLLVRRLVRKGWVRITRIKGYEVWGIIRRSSSFNTGRLDSIYQDPMCRSESYISFTVISTMPRH